MKDKESIVSIQRTHLWDYFALHAYQRITLLRFYTIILGLFITSVGFVMIKFPENTILEEIMASLLCIIFLVLTIIFHLLDHRNRQLIHNTEEKIRAFEKKHFDEECQIFQNEFDQKLKGNSAVGHTTCFFGIFCTSYILSALLLIASIILACYYSHASIQKDTIEQCISSCRS